MLIRRHIHQLAVAQAQLREEGRLLLVRLAERGADARVYAVVQAYADAVRFHTEREVRFVHPAILALAEGDEDSRLAVRDMVGTMTLEHQELLRLARRVEGALPADSPERAGILDWLEATRASMRQEEAVVEEVVFAEQLRAAGK